MRVSADQEHVDQAKRFVDALDAAGGTEMVPAMRWRPSNDRGLSDGNYVARSCSSPTARSATSNSCSIHHRHARPLPRLS